MSDIYIILIGTMILLMLIVPTTMFMVEKYVVIIEKENIKDIVDLALNYSIVKLELTELSQGDLNLIEYVLKNSLLDYFNKNKFQYNDVIVQIEKYERQMFVNVTVSCDLEKHIFKKMLFRVTEYKLTRKVELPTDR